MILAIDTGNTNIVIGGIDAQKTHFLERVTTSIHRTDLEYAVTIKNILEIHGISKQMIEGVILSSVVPPLNQTLINAVKKITGLKCFLVDSNSRTGMPVLMDHPETVGSDLIVDSVAAMHEYPLPLAVVDLGTATTITVVDKDGNYIGGIIHPGLRVSLESLSNKTAQLPHIDPEHAGSLIAKNTVESMQSGILYGHAAVIDGILDRMEKEYGESFTVIATGGSAPAVIPLCRRSIIVDDSLMLKGLLIIFDLNVRNNIKGAS